MEKEHLIDKYIQGTLNEDERLVLEKLKLDDPDIQKEIDLLSDLKIVTELEDRTDLKNLLKDTETKLTQGETKVIPLFRKSKFWIAAASIVIIAAIGITSLLSPFSPSVDELYAENFEPYKNVVNPSVRSEGNIDAEKQAFITYENKKYSEALKQFKALYEETSKSYFLLYQANCLMALNNMQQAIPLLEKHSNEDTPLAIRSKWYLSLAYLKEGNKEKAKELLTEVISEGGFKSTAATRLLQKLD